MRFHFLTFSLWIGSLWGCSVEAEGTFDGPLSAGGTSTQGGAGQGGSGQAGTGVGTSGKGGAPGGTSGAGGTAGSGDAGQGGLSGSSGQSGAAGEEGGEAGTSGAAGDGQAGSEQGGEAGEGGSTGTAGQGAGQGGTSGTSGQSGAGQGGNGGVGGNGGTGAGTGGAGNGGTGGAPAVCGDGKLDPPEEACDGASLGNATCASVTGFPAAQGQLSCKDDCTLDTSGCTFCGDGKKNAQEACDGGDLGGATCQTLHGSTAQGTLSCADNCQLLDACTFCGDGTKNNGEECDFKGNDPLECPGKIGEAACTTDCKIDTSGCKDPSCTDTVKNGSETDIDCGGQCAAACASTKACSAPNDCQTPVCAGNTKTCAEAQTCTQKSDCNNSNANCIGERCMPPTGELHTAPSAGACPIGWAAIGNSCYTRVDTPATWYDAFKGCRARGGNLAVLNSGTELNDAGKSASGANLNDNNKKIWAGFACVNQNDCSNMASWRWLGNLNVANEWGQQGPANNERCGYIRLRYDNLIGFSSDPCTTTLPYLCERAP